VQARLGGRWSSARVHALCSGAVALACHLVLAQVACQGGDREHLSHVKRRTQGLRVAGKLHGFFKVRTRGREIKVVQGGKACAKKRKSNAADESSLHWRARHGLHVGARV